MNHVLSDEDRESSSDVEKNEIDGNVFKTTMMDDDAELNKVLGEEVAWGDFDFDDGDIGDIDNMVHPDGLLLDDLDESDGSVDRLSSMPIVEVYDDQVEQLLRNIADEENISIPSSHMYPSRTTQQVDQTRMHEAQPDPLLGRLSRAGNNNIYTSMASPPSSQPFVLQEMAQEVDALQRMVDDAVMYGVPMNNHPTVSSHNQVLDLEQEKFKLLSRLNEINQRQHMTNTVSSLMSSGNMPQRGNSMASQTKPAGIASVGDMRSAGETPLTSFLRKNQKAQPAAAAGTNTVSMNNPLIPNAASVFTGSSMQLNNRLVGHSGNQNPLFGAMDRTTMSQEMVRKLSARSILARSDSGQLLPGGIHAQEYNDRNAAWGDDPLSAKGFKSSGILPRHASDNHLLRASSKSGMIRSRSKNTSLSRENLLYMKRSSRNNSEDSLGSLLPVKRSGGAKYKVGHSRSTPRLMMNGHQGGQSGSQMNAMW